MIQPFIRPFHRNVFLILLMALALAFAPPVFAGPPKYAGGNPTTQTLQGDARLSKGIPFSWKVTNVLDCYDFMAEEKKLKLQSSAAAMMVMRVATVVARPDAKNVATLTIPPLTAELLNGAVKNSVKAGERIEVSHVEVTVYSQLGSQIMTYKPDPDHLRKQFPSTPQPAETKRRLSRNGGDDLV